MSTLTNIDKIKLEKLLGMSSGYVLDFNNQSFGEFIYDSVGVDIWDDKYDYSSGSKANRLRALWSIEPDSIVGKVLKDLLECWRTETLLSDQEVKNNEEALYEECLKIATRISGETQVEEGVTEDEFIKKEFKEVSVSSLKLNGAITDILNQRLQEIKKCLNSKASLACIFLCGSTLEGILLGVALNHPRKFNQAKASPRKEGKVLQFHEWTLSNFIDVAKETEIINEDVRKFSHVLRDFRNYIHPYQQASHKFNPDEHTAKLCWQVLKLAIYQVAKNQ